MPTRPLSAVPLTVVENGNPRFGVYQGLVGHADWTQLRGPYQRGWWWRLRHHKQWQYAAIFTPDVVLGLAVVHIGYAANGFLYLFDRQRQQMLLDRSRVMPAGAGIQVGLPGEGADTFFRTADFQIHLSWPVGINQFQVAIQTRDGLEVDAALDMTHAPMPMTAIAQIPKAIANCTQKHACIPVRGQARMAGRSFDLSEGVATLDHTNGLLARDTRWRWASGHSRDIGFNLVDGFNDNIENVLWHDGDLFRVGEARFDFDRSTPLSPWRVTTDDGLVDLTFKPEGMREKDEDLVVALSRYVQPIGVFSGTVRRHPDGPAIPINGIPGVTEDHQARW